MEPGLGSGASVEPQDDVSHGGVDSVIGLSLQDAVPRVLVDAKCLIGGLRPLMEKNAGRWVVDTISAALHYHHRPRHLRHLALDEVRCSKQLKGSS